MQTYTLEIQDDVLPQVLAVLQNTFSKNIKIKPQQIKKSLVKSEQRADLDLNEDFDNLSSLDYLAVSDDKTDEKWLTNLFSLMDKAFNESELAGQTISERDWTRDEIYQKKSVRPELVEG